MTASKLYWHKEPANIYNYHMTMVASLMAKDGMLFISDGRVNDLDHNIISDEQVKLFELSPLTVILPAGGASDQIESLMKMFKNVFTTSGISNVNDVVVYFCKFWQNEVTLDGDTWPAFIIAGYNMLPTGRHEPKIYYMHNNQGEWELLETRGENTFFTMGSSKEPVNNFLVSEYGNENEALLNSRNKSALKALKIAENSSPKYVGGQTSLWNLKPRRPIKKFSSSEIERLKNRL